MIQWVRKMPGVRLKLLSVAALGLLLLAGAPQHASASSLDAAVLQEMNFARSHPSEYARELSRQGEAEDPEATGFAYEDPDAFDEAIDFLRRQPPLPPLRPDERLAAAALAHTAGQGPRGDVGHGGPGGGDSLGERLHRHGVWAGLAAENISYGYRSPRDIVRQLIVDSGVPNRGHRQNIFGRAYQVAGVACGRHRVYGSMCTVDFAGALVKR